MINTGSRASAFFWGGVLGLVLTTVALQFLLRGLVVTGDEPGYIYKALSFWHTGGFHMPPARFGLEMPGFEYLVRTNADLGSAHPVLMSMIGAPLAGPFGVAGVRWIPTLCAVVSIIAVSLLLRREFESWIALLATGFMVFTLPTLPYSHLFYTELPMLMLVAASWALGRSGGRACALLAVLCALALPFVHIRSSLLSLALVGFASYPLWRRRDWHGLAAAACLCGLGAGLFAGQQIVLFGRLVAGATATFSPSFADALPRLAVQLVEFRHGLMVVNPACVLAIAGLVLGAWRRSALGVQGCTLLLCYVPPMIWGTASESWPARFWTPAMPAMAVGMAFWLAHVRGIPAKAAGAGLALTSLLNSFILLRYNGSFLEDRFGFLAGDQYSPLRDHFDIAGLLPWDSFDFTAFGIDPATALDERLLTRAGLFCLALVLAFVLNGLANQRWAKWSSWLPIVILLPLLTAMSMRPLPSEEMTMKQEDQAVVFDFSCQAPVRLIRIITPARALMVPPAYPSGLEIIAVRGDGSVRAWRAPFAPVLGLPAGQYRSIRLAASGIGAAGVWRQANFVTLAAGLRVRRCN
jgi:hypothetical protein